LVFDAGDIGGIGADKVAVGALGGIERDGGAAENKAAKPFFVLLGRAVAPVNAVGLALLSWW